MAGEDKPDLRMHVEQDPPTEVKVGGIRTRQVGSLKLKHVDPIELAQMKEMPGVETELV